MRTNYIPMLKEPSQRADVKRVRKGRMLSSKDPGPRGAVSLLRMGSLSSPHYRLYPNPRVKNWPLLYPVPQTSNLN
ncbi:hypothetical protein GN956_G3578 [Arapaima gigas]